LKPEVVLSAVVGIVASIASIASIAFDSTRDRELRAIDARCLFEVNVTRLAVRCGAWLQRYVFDFIEAFAPGGAAGARGEAEAMPLRAVAASAWPRAA
jgi:LysR family transcriptional regulator, cys regulon transcriptional activator